MKHRAALAGALAAVLVTAACGSGGGSSASSSSGSSATTTTTASAGTATADPVEWAGTFCAGIEPSIDGVLGLLKVMFEGGAEDKAVLKAALVDFSAKAGKSVSDAGAKLDDLGPPSADARSLHDDLTGFFTDSGKTLTDFNTEVAKLDPADPEFDAKLERMGGSDQADLLSKLQEQIKKLQDDPALGEAFKRAPQCVQLNEKMKSLGG